MDLDGQPEDQLDELRRDHLVRGAGDHHLAVAHGDHVVRVPAAWLRSCEDGDDGPAVGVEPLEQVEHLALVGQVEERRRLVEQHRRRVLGEGHRLRLPTTAAVVPFTTRWEEAEGEAGALLDRVRPKALIAIERPGANEHGRYHAAKGFDFSDHCAKVDVLFEQAKTRGILTIGIGDGGNELGCALIRDTVIQEVPYGKKCQCPCGGTVVPRFEPDVLVMAAISNWGAYGIAAALAVLIGRAEVMHSREVDRRAHELCAAAEANNDGPGLLDPGTDAVPAHLHGNFVELLQHMVQSGLDFGRLYGAALPMAPL